MSEPLLETPAGAEGAARDRMETSDGRPLSAVSTATGLVGLVGLLSAVVVLAHVDTGLAVKSLVCLAATALPMLLWGILVEKVHLRPSTGLDFSKPRPLSSTLETTTTKLIGLWATWLALGVFYISVRYYSTDQFIFYFAMIKMNMLPLITTSVIYIFLVDRYSTEPHDGLWHMGRWVLGDVRSVDRQKLADHARSWFIKAFFLAFMFSILPGVVRGVTEFPTDELIFDPISSATLLIRTMFLIDVCFGTIGYILTLRPLDSHIRSANPYLSAWIAALACYPPVALMGTGGPLDYRSGTMEWSVWLAGNTVLLTVWGGALVVLAAIYAWATVIFGFRFSNLTHRGIITNGPYRYVRHPAYLSKNLFWWLAHIPVLSPAGGLEAARNCILLLSVNFIYYLRAKTEEMHLNDDVDYRRYSAWIASNGIIARCRHRVLRRSLF